MALPLYFQFSQSSLQDFEACACRFKLRYLEQLPWPAIESQPVQETERLAQLGTDFHRLVQQHLVGIAAPVLTNSLGASEGDLQTWWQNYLHYRPVIAAESQLYPEVTLSTPLRGYRLIARFDLLVAQPDGTFLIFDWKTAQRKPPRNTMANWLQTRVYPYVLAMAGADFNNGQSIDPLAIQMIYWYSAKPDQPEQFVYNRQLWQQDEQFLSNLIEQVKQASQTNTFPLVEDKKACRYCVYRSFCHRGAKAGSVTALAEESIEVSDVLAFDWDQSAEIRL